MTKRGRNPILTEPAERDTAYLVVSDHELIKELGDGSFTYGVRFLVDFYREAQKRAANGDGRQQVEVEVEAEHASLN